MRRAWMLTPLLAVQAAPAWAQSQGLNPIDGHAAPLVGTLCVNSAPGLNTFGLLALMPCTGTYASGSLALVAGTAATIFPAATTATRLRIKLQNFDAAADIWCKWAGTAAVGGVGSFKLAANGGGIDDSGPGVNQGALSCIAASGAPNLLAEEY